MAETFTVKDILMEMKSSLNTRFDHIEELYKNNQIDHERFFQAHKDIYNAMELVKADVMNEIKILKAFIDEYKGQSKSSHNWISYGFTAIAIAIAIWSPLK